MICTVCSTPFDPLWPAVRRVTCSSSCAREHRRRQGRVRAARYYRAHRGERAKGTTCCSTCGEAGHNKRRHEAPTVALAQTCDGA